jgi:dual specificity tyrosine-phosphorylation-regulated kinase 2/3/4
MKSNKIVDAKRKIPLLAVNRSRNNLQNRVDKSKFVLTKEEERVYGERFPAGYKKIKVLGRGGCAIVWLGEDSETGKQVAVKQVSRISGINAVESCKREIHFGNLINDLVHPATSSIIRLLDSKSDKADVWALYELGNTSLSKALFQVKGEFVKGERMYLIQHPDLYSEFTDIAILKSFIKELLQVVQFLSSMNIVHSDLKPDNILVNTDKYLGIKVIDFGSAYNYRGNGSISTVTPEYMPPEALEIAHSPGNHISHLASFSEPWSFDVWSAGMIVLEIVTGIPLWMSLKSRVEKMGKLVTCRGLLAASARDPETILKLQAEITNNVHVTVNKYAAFSVPSSLVDLLSRMLAWEPARRICPTDALSHDFFKS